MSVYKSVLSLFHGTDASTNDNGKHNKVFAVQKVHFDVVSQDLEQWLKDTYKKEQLSIDHLALLTRGEKIKIIKVLLQSILA